MTKGKISLRIFQFRLNKSKLSIGEADFCVLSVLRFLDIGALLGAI